MTRENGNPKMYRDNHRFFLASMIFAILIFLASCGESLKEFCYMAETCEGNLTTSEINDYYTRLEAVAPSEIKDDVTTLLKGWYIADVDFNGNLSTPDYVWEAAKNVMNFVEDRCGPTRRTGVYLVLYPHIGGCFQ